MLARALCAAEKLIVLDEPVAGLDPKATADIYALINDLNKREGLTVMMVSHDIRAAIRYSTHILRINKGSVFFGSVEDFKALPDIKPYLDTLDEIPEPEQPYGEGGFRYGGDK
jgi:zinc transport system ATP-binding protein